MTPGLEFWLSILVSLFVGGVAGAWAANLRFEVRVLQLEHEMWGPKANNGMKKRMETAEANILALHRLETRDIERMNRRNRRQHPEDYSNGSLHEGEE